MILAFWTRVEIFAQHFPYLHWFEGLQNIFCCWACLFVLYVYFFFQVCYVLLRSALNAFGWILKLASFKLLLCSHSLLPVLWTVSWRITAFRRHPASIWNIIILRSILPAGHSCKANQAWQVCSKQSMWNNDTVRHRTREDSNKRWFIGLLDVPDLFISVRGRERAGKCIHVCNDCTHATTCQLVKGLRKIWAYGTVH